MVDPSKLESYKHRNVLLKKAEQLQMLIIPLFCLSAVALIVGTGTILELRNGTQINSDNTIPVMLFKTAMLLHSIMLVGLITVFYLRARTKSKYESIIIMHESELESLIEDRTEKLNKKTKELESIYKALPDVFFLLDTDGGIKNITDHNFKGSESREDTLGKNIREFLPSSIHEQLTRALKTTAEKNTLTTIECDAEIDGRCEHIECRFALSEEKYITCAVRDITQRNEYEISLQKALNEQEILMSEIHHRVKNNLMMIISLISFYDDPNHQLNDLSNKIYSISLIHEQLYNNKLLSQLEIREYIRDLVNHLLSASSDSTIDINISVPDIYFTPEKAVPLGLIVSELLTPAIKCWPDDQDNKILEINMIQINNTFELRISCNNRELTHKTIPDDQSISNKLIKILVEQLSGDLSFKHQQRAEVVLKFPA